MKREFTVLFSMALVLVMVVLITAGCSGGSVSGQSASEPVTQAASTQQTETTIAPTTMEKTTVVPTTQKPTEPTTEKPTEPPTEAPKPKTYTTEELLVKSVPEILELLDYDITVESNDSHYGFGGSTGSICFYNFDKLPGFVFSPKDVIYKYDNTDLTEVKQNIINGDYETLSFVAAIEGAKLSDKISSDMSYNEISGITGNYSTTPPAGQGLIMQSLSDYCSNCKFASVTYETSREAMQHMSSSGYDEEFLKQENPKAMYIVAYPQ